MGLGWAYLKASIPDNGLRQSWIQSVPATAFAFPERRLSVQPFVYLEPGEDYGEWKVCVWLIIAWPPVMEADTGSDVDGAPNSEESSRTPAYPEAPSLLLSLGLSSSLSPCDVISGEFFCFHTPLSELTWAEYKTCLHTFRKYSPVSNSGGLGFIFSSGTLFVYLFIFIAATDICGTSGNIYWIVWSLEGGA